LSYEAEHVDGIYIEVDAAGRPYRIHRKIILSAQQAMDKWKEKSPKEVVDAMTGRNPTPDRDFTFVHCIEKNSKMLTGRLDAAGMPWLGGYYLEGGEDNMFDNGGYQTLPRIVSAFDRGLNQHYGKCPAMFVLPEIRASQVMKQDRVLAVEQKTKPPILAMDDALDRGVLNLGPYGVTYGGLDERGNPTLQPWFEGQDLSDAAALHQEERDMIDRAFYRDLFQINKEYKTHISATRTMEEIAEKGIFLGPLARQEEEWLSPMLPRELWLMDQMGLLDDMPPEMAEYFAAEGGMDVMYDNNLTRMQEASGAVGLLRTGEMVTSLGSIDPEYIEAYKRQYDPNVIVAWLGRNNGIPAMLERSDDDKEAFDNDKAMATQMQEALAAAPVLADAAKNFAQAEQVNVG
nr:portal protein [Sphingorhabdus sp.]